MRFVELDLTNRIDSSLDKAELIRGLEPEKFPIEQSVEQAARHLELEVFDRPMLEFLLRRLLDQNSQVRKKIPTPYPKLVGMCKRLNLFLAQDLGLPMRKEHR